MAQGLGERRPIRSPEDAQSRPAAPPQAAGFARPQTRPQGRARRARLCLRGFIQARHQQYGARVRLSPRTWQYSETGQLSLRCARLPLRRLYSRLLCYAKQAGFGCPFTLHASHREAPATLARRPGRADIRPCGGTDFDADVAVVRGLGPAAMALRQRGLERAAGAGDQESHHDFQQYAAAAGRA